MILKAFAVYDNKSETYKQPFFVATKGLALRAFVDAVNNPETELQRHPEDFKLVQLGEFDDVSGVFSATMPESLGFARDFLRHELGAVTPIGHVKERAP